jgi:hypothetical protein
MNEDERQGKRQAKMEAVRQHIRRNNEAWLAWSERAAESFVHELVSGNLIRPDQSDFARKIIAQDLHDAGKRSFGRVLGELQRLHSDGQS